MSTLSQFIGGGGGGKLKFQRFNSSGTFSPPAALLAAGGNVWVLLVGGGGGGAGYGYDAYSNYFYGACGGHGGVQLQMVNVVGPVTVTIGAGGAPGSGGAAGSAGGQSSFGSLVSGGGGGAGSAAGPSAGGAGTYGVATSPDLQGLLGSGGGGCTSGYRSNGYNYPGAEPVGAGGSGTNEGDWRYPIPLYGYGSVWKQSSAAPNNSGFGGFKGYAGGSGVCIVWWYE